MIITALNIPDVKLIEPTVLKDERGYFFESFRADIVKIEVGEINFVQDNESKSSFGTLRGLHYQLPPYAQSKLVRVVQGRVLDVAVDIRKDSSTFGKFVSEEPSGENGKQLFIPRGFAHGFVVLSETAIFQYKVDNYYNKESEGGIIYNDSILSIDWRIDSFKIVLSNKDQLLPMFSDAIYFTNPGLLY
ncbi:MAG: dTDP-4-dehydrorhamnose 3,5-epimerase [Stygiobacter sp.]|nr:MAG: dTDP-4-dehydrorhamnose 3,5-epimerase [Stygiobacter sp.]